MAKSGYIADSWERFEEEIGASIKRSRATWVISAVVLVIVSVVLIRYAVTHESGNEIIALLFLLTVVIRGFVTWYKNIVDSMIFYFLESNGFSKAKVPQIEMFQCKLFAKGRDKTISKFHQNEKIKTSYFKYQFTTGRGRSRHTTHLDIFVSDTRDSFPYIEISPDRTMLHGGVRFGWRRIALESNEFNEHYTVYVKNSNISEDWKVYKLLEPNVIELLARIQADAFSIEIVGNQMFFIFDQLPRKHAQLEAILLLIEKINE
ncbi:MAG: hypothetical protein UY09_C0003G0005 [Parcubacteria group bacterium GW2011_GWA2_47_8]|nr:MAG: hypothetical protein UY09_C0003G0005 [Parcubacteria group bacterium GW2011_GWA2_47_8]OHB18442.1 MAG: hypothetical protein A2666_05145 [Parcubacteria group bacterium RIFCSPHIGHO2_01_FULL_47_10b]